MKGRPPQGVWPTFPLHDSVVTWGRKAARGGAEQELTKQRRRCQVCDSSRQTMNLLFSKYNRKNITFEDSREKLQLGLHIECVTWDVRGSYKRGYLGLVKTRLSSKWQWHKALTFRDRWTDNERYFQKNVGQESYLVFICDKTKIIVGAIIFS